MEQIRFDNIDKKIRFIDLFAGIGGFRTAMDSLGGECVFSCEIDKYCQKVYEHNYGDVPFGDITQIDEKEVPEHDILLGGFPCQAFSIAGKRAGFEDTRGTLFFDVARIIKEKKPKAFILENVKGLINHNKGNTLAVILETLRNDLEYYVPDPQIVNAKDFGVPQNRERIFIVGFLDNQVAEEFNFPNKIPLTNVIAEIVNLDDVKPDKYYYNNTVYYEDLVNAMERQDTIYQLRRGQYIRENKNNVCPTLTANMGTGGHNVPLIKDNHDIRKLTPEECLLFQGFNVDDEEHLHTFPEYIEDANGRRRIFADCHKYKQAGNCVTVTVIERIVANMLNAYEAIHGNIEG